MYRVLLCAALAGILSVPAKADETVKWRHVQYTASAQTQQIDDVNGHSLNLLRFPGIAFFTDGSTGTTLVIGRHLTRRYAGAQGDGTFEGETPLPATAGEPAIGYIDNVINIKK